MEVLCTNGVKSVMLDLIPAFERTSGTKIVITWGSTNGLLKDLEGGAGGDLAILTAEAIDDLVYHYLDVIDALGLGSPHVVGASFGGSLAVTASARSSEPSGPSATCRA